MSPISSTSDSAHPRSGRLLAGVFLSALLSIGCQNPPEEAANAFSWQESVSGMRDAMLGSCAFGGNLYAVGGVSSSAAVYRLSGGRWRQEAGTLSGERLWACWAGPSETVIAVGQSGTIYHHSKEGWFQAQLPEDVALATLYGVWGMPDGTAVAVGGGLIGPRALAVILHYDGQRWTRADASALETKTLNAVWGSSADNYWAVGNGGEIAHFDGQSWSRGTSQVTDKLNAIHGASRDEIYAVGGVGRGLVLRYNGSSWVLFDEPEASLRAVWTPPAPSTRPLVVAGESGYFGRYRRGQALPQPSLFSSNTSHSDLRIQSLLGFGKAVFATASSNEVGEDGQWRGSVLGHGRSFAGLVVVDPSRPGPDAGMPDAGMQDAGTQDAGTLDSGVPDAL